MLQLPYAMWDREPVSLRLGPPINFEAELDKMVKENLQRQERESQERALDQWFTVEPPATVSKKAASRVKKRVSPSREEEEAAADRRDELYAKRRKARREDDDGEAEDTTFALKEAPPAPVDNHSEKKPRCRTCKNCFCICDD